MSDRIAVMFEGRIAQVAAPQTLYRRPVDKQVADFIGVMNFLPARARHAGDGIEVDIAGLGTTALDGEQCPAGRPQGAAEVGIRPEMMSLLFDGQTAGAGQSVSEGKVVEQYYYGDMTYYDVALPDVDQPLTLSMKNLVGRPVLDRGDTARVAWDARALVAFPA